MTQTVVIDTCVFISYPNCLKEIKDNVVIPIVVLEELDKLKTSKEEVSKKARAVIRNLDNIFDQGDPVKGVKLPGGNIVKIDGKDYGSVGEQMSYGDNKILALLVANKKKNWKLISEDISLRIRAKSLGVAAARHASDSQDSLYTGYEETMDQQLMNDLMMSECVKLEEDLLPNEFLKFTNKDGEDIYAGRQAGEVLKRVEKRETFDIYPKNIEQACALDLLRDPSVPLVTLSGRAGCGKTLLALAAALEAVVRQRKYSKIIIYRPIQPIGQSLGFAPGTIFEKLMVWNSAILDNLEILLSNSKGKNKHWKEQLEMWVEKGVIEFDSLTFIRGRSLPNAYIIVDETQNLPNGKDDVKTFLSRVGEGTKIVLTGDIEQIDNKGVNRETNALTQTMNLFKDSKLAGHLTMHTTVRSKLAAEALDRLG